MHNSDDEHICMSCGRTFEWPDALYCPYCGSVAFNFCTNEDCQMCVDNDGFQNGWALPQNFKYCPECGYKTAYYDSIKDSDLPQ